MVGRGGSLTRRARMRVSDDQSAWQNWRHGQWQRTASSRMLLVGYHSGRTPYCQSTPNSTGYHPQICRGWRGAQLRAEGGERLAAPTYIFTLCTAIGGKQYWFWIKVTSLTPASHPVTFFYPGWISTETTPPLISAWGERNEKVRGWRRRKYDQGLKVPFGRTAIPWQW